MNYASLCQRFCRFFNYTCGASPISITLTQEDAKRKMTEKKTRKTYPVTSLHDFLSELDREWNKFRVGSLISLISTGLLIFFVLRFLLGAIRHLQIVDILFLFFVTIALVYSVYAMFAQYRFFNRWERRMGLLLHLEEKLMSEKLEGKTSE